MYKQSLILGGLLGLLLVPCLTAAEAPNSASLAPKRKLFVQGITAFQHQHYDEAITSFEQLTGKYTELDDYVRFFLARTLVETDDAPRALNEFQQFLTRYPSHPLADEVRLQIANLLFNDERYADALNWYTQLLEASTPDTGEFFYRLGRSAFETGAYQQAVDALQQVRVYHPTHPTAKDARQYLQMILKTYPNLEPQWTAEMTLDHADALLQGRAYDEAVRQYEAFLNAYPQSDRLEDAEFSKIAAYFRAGNAKAGIAALDALVTQYADAHPQIAARALYMRGYQHWNADRNTQARELMQRLVKDFPQTSWTDDAYYVIGRIYQSQRQYPQAARWYADLAQNYPSGDSAEEGLWRAGWARYLNAQYEQAAQLFATVPNRFPGGAYRDDSLYWQGRALEKTKQRDAAIRVYRQLVQISPDTYYGILAQKRLRLFQVSVERSSAEAERHPEFSEIFQRLRQILPPDTYKAVARRSTTISELRAVNLSDYAVKETAWVGGILGIADEAPDVFTEPQETVAGDNAGHRLMMVYFLARLYAFAGDYLSTIQLSSKIETFLEQTPGYDFPYMLHRLKYPLAYSDLIQKYAELNNVDPFLIAGIIRQESAYNSQARSYADARGLMQLIPSTGKRVAAREGIENFTTSRLYEPELNIRLGTRYLVDVLDRFDGNLYRALAAYNAGPKATEKWWPTSGTGDQELIVENITYRATRNYVKRVLRNQHNYRLIYADTQPR